MIQRLTKNTLGKDYVVGDIHGCFSKLRTQLDYFFNPKTDRLFATGDLVDRGPESLAAIRWLEQPWFYSVRGNHEDMILRAYQGSDHWQYNSIRNGGLWFFELEKKAQDRVASALFDMPSAIEIDKRFGIVHADVLSSWPEFLKQPDREETYWSRDRVYGKWNTPVEGIERLYVGHTPTKLDRLQNVYFMDNGAWAKECDFKIRELV